MKKKTLGSLKTKQINLLTSKKTLSNIKGGRRYNSDEGERVDISA